MTAIDLVRATPTPTAENIRHGMSAVLCRCTGYEGIVDAVLEYAKSQGGDKT